MMFLQVHQHLHHLLWINIVVKKARPTVILLKYHKCWLNYVKAACLTIGLLLSNSCFKRWRAFADASKAIEAWNHACTYICETKSFLQISLHQFLTQIVFWTSTFCNSRECMPIRNWRWPQWEIWWQVSGTLYNHLVVDKLADSALWTAKCAL